MNIYAIIAVILLIIILGHFFNLGPAIEQFALRMADIPSFDNKGDSPALFDLAVRLAYLIAIVGIIKVIMPSRKKDDQHL